MSKVSLNILILVLINFKGLGECANILFIHHMGSYSHVVASMPLAKALVQKGHNVTYITAAASTNPHPNIKEIVPKEVKKYFDDLLDQDCDVSSRLDGTMPNWWSNLDSWTLTGCQILLESPEFKNWLESTPKIDLIYIDNHPECAFGIAQKLQSKLSIFVPCAMNPRHFDAFGMPSESSSIPTWDVVYKTPLSFINRIKNTLTHLGWRFNQKRHWSQMESIIMKNLNISKLPTLDELYQTIGVVLLNGHFMDEYQRSLPPIFVNVPGLHVLDSHGPLPKEIEAFVESRGADDVKSEGFIYISFGTVAKAPKLPQEIREAFFESMKAFPTIRFLWRWDGEFPKDKPNNLYLSKWFHQQDLLGNEKIRGFITQAGRPSSQEAVYNAVPMITFPILADQDYNSNLLEILGVSINLEIADITAKKLTSALSKILHDKSIKERSIEVSKLYRDLPMKPIDTAVWWTEYVLRHNNTNHLNSLGMNQTWYERRSLDVWAFLTIAALLFLFFLSSFFHFVTKLGNSSTNSDPSKNVLYKKMK